MLPRCCTAWRSLLALLVVALLLSSCTLWQRPAQPKGSVANKGLPQASGPSSARLSEFLKGMSYVGYNRDVFASPQSDDMVRAIAASGANTLVVVPVWYQDQRTSTLIAPWPDRSPSDDSLVHVIRLAHTLGLKVALKPFVDAKDGTWRALFAPSSWSAWFQSYTDFILHYARLAQAEGADLFVVGVEYSSSDATQPAAWRAVIKAVREAYRGPISYAADWPTYQKVGFWDAVDYIGIDAYFPLATEESPSLAQLEAGWRRAQAEIEAWRRVTGHKRGIIFTEVGYQSKQGAARDPAGYANPGPADPQLQARAYEATFRTVYQAPWLVGIFWFWWDNPSLPDWGGGLQDSGYTPRGKPAEKVLATWFKRPRPLATAVK